MPQYQVARQGRTSQVEVAILEAELLGGRGLVFDLERGRLRRIQNLDARGQNLDVAGRQFRILSLLESLDDLSVHADDKFRAKSLGRSNDFGVRRTVLIDDDLADAAAIPHIDEDELSEVALFLHPSLQDDRLPDVFSAQGPG